MPPHEDAQALDGCTFSTTVVVLVLLCALLQVMFTGALVADITNRPGPVGVLPPVACWTGHGCLSLHVHEHTR